MSLVTIMQFSDLHKRASALDSNKALISSIVSDIARYNKEEIPISKPNILIVCGDIIRGSGPTLNFELSIQEIEQQYNEANDFLSQLCNELFDENKKRIVIVPGNHDVSWPHSQKSMEKLEKLDPNFVDLCKTPTRNIRWSWKEHSYYKISNYELYNQRFFPFSKFYTTFYNNQRKYSLKPEEQYDVFEFPEYKMLFVGFNSCFCNDHLNYIGMIHPECMANCHNNINQAKYNDWLKIAVWHHGVHGFPTRSDFMDERIVQFLIDKGFQIGLHGHQHKSDFFEVKFSADQSIAMQIFGCGTLCASQQDIPLGETRQYSIIELDSSTTDLKFHIRKAVEQPLGLPIWMPGNIRQNKDKSCMNIKTPITINTDKGKKQEMQSKLDLLKELAEAENLVAKKDYSEALRKLKLLDQENPFVRRLTIECLSQLEMDDECIRFIKEPNTITEFTYLSEALWRKKNLPDLRKLLDESSQNPDIANSEPFKRMNSKLKYRGN